MGQPGAAGLASLAGRDDRRLGLTWSVLHVVSFHQKNTKKQKGSDRPQEVHRNPLPSDSYSPRYGASAGLLAFGSSYSPHLPVPLRRNSGALWISSPITAAGPPRNCTVFQYAW